MTFDICVLSILAALFAVVIIADDLTGNKLCICTQAVNRALSLIMNVVCILAAPCTSCMSLGKLRSLLSLCSLTCKRRVVIALPNGGWSAHWGSTIKSVALAGVDQWIECWPANQRVSGSIPSQGTCLGCVPGPQSGGAYERQPHIDVSLPLFLPAFPSL